MYICLETQWFSTPMMSLFPCVQLESQCFFADNIQTNDMGAIDTYGDVKIFSQNDGKGGFF